MNEIITNEIKKEQKEENLDEINILENVFKNSFIPESNILENMEQKEENIINDIELNISNEIILDNTDKIKNRFLEILNYRKELNLSK